MKALLAALTLVPTLAVAQMPDFSKVQVTASPVAGNVHMLVGAGGNVAVSVGPDGVLVVDDQFAPLVPKLHAAIDKLSKKKIQYVLNTHWHFDHTGGNPLLGKEGLIVAHDKVRMRLATEQKLFGQPSAPLPKEGLPVITFDNHMSLFFNGEEIRLTHLPAGHTDGDTAVYFTNSNVLHTGDQFIVDMFPFFDMENGGTVEGYVRNLETLLQTLPAGVKIIPGHGPLAKKEDMERMLAMLKETTALVRSQRDAGRTLEQVQAQGVPEKYKGFSGPFIKEAQYLEFLYKGLPATAKSPAAPAAPAPAPKKP
jgi:glyoxylase-like metal-dependent hydrolase (beta-lactamase superfamily II)